MTTGLSDATIRLRTLGFADLRAPDGTQIQSVLRQPKRLALLIYLALAGPGFQRRDRLLAMFWPESDLDHARLSLNQAIYQLRTALGRESIPNRGEEEVGLAPDRIWCDATEFDRLVRAGRLAEAMELYTGELLPGFNIDDAPEFERWLDEERSRRADRAAGVSLDLSAAAEREGNGRSAIAWARRSVSLQPYSESAYQRLIVLLDRAGDRAGALQAFETLRDLLQTEFAADPSAETNALISAVRTRAESQGQEPRLGFWGNGDQTAAPVDTRRSRSSILIFAAVAAVVLVAGVLWAAISSRRPAVYQPPANHVAVLYFADQSANRGLDYLAEGLTSTLIEQLGLVKQLQVVSQNGVRAFRGESIPLDSIARQLDVGTIVGGSITSSNDRLRVTVQLIDGATGMVKHTVRFERPNGELFALLDDVTTEVAAFLRTRLGAEIRLREWQSETRSVEAWRLSSRAEVLRTTADSAQRMGDVNASARDLELADSLLARAVRLDRGWPAPIVMRGQLAERRAWMSMIIDRPPRSAEWLRAALDHANQALRMDARNYAAYELRGSVNLAKSLMEAQSGVNVDSLVSEAERDFSAALQINPELPRAESRLSAALYMQGRFADAHRAALRALRADAYLTDADDIVNRLFYTSFEMDDDEEAGYWCDEIRRRSPNRWTSGYCDLVLLGWSSLGPDPRKALHLLDNAGTADSPAMQAVMRPQLTMLAAGVVARAGRADSARVMLQRARAASPSDVELLHLEASVRVILKEYETARRLLDEYYRARPNAKPRIESRRMFRPLRESAVAQRP